MQAQSTRSVERPFLVPPLGAPACCVEKTTAIAIMRQATSTANGMPPGCRTYAPEPHPQTPGSEHPAASCFMTTAGGVTRTPPNNVDSLARGLQQSV